MMRNEFKQEISEFIPEKFTDADQLDALIDWIESCATKARIEELQSIEAKLLDQGTPGNFTEQILDDRLAELKKESEVTE